MQEKMKNIIDIDAAKTNSTAALYATIRHNFRRFRPKKSNQKATQARRIVKSRNRIIAMRYREIIHAKITNASTGCLRPCNRYMNET